MREMEWIFCKPLESTDLIEEYEQVVGYTFPKTFKECVKKHNAGDLKYMLFDSESFGPQDFVLCSFNKEDRNSIWGMNELYVEFRDEIKQDGLNKQSDLVSKKCEIFTQKYIQFASSYFGTIYAFDKTNGDVVLVNKMTDNKPLKIEKIANSFDEFIEKLYERKSLGAFDDLKWYSIRKLKDINLIEEYEQVIGYKFPKTFKECVKKYNGGSPKNMVVSDVDDDFTLHSFNKDDENGIWGNENLFSGYIEQYELSYNEEMLEYLSFDPESQKEYKNELKNLTNLKDHFVVFASGWTGNFYAFDKRDNSVVYVDRDEFDRIIFLEDSFDDFIENLQIHTEE